VAGAGIAGLAAAYRLQQAGWEVEVFEADQFAGDYLSQTGQNTAVAWGNRAAANLHSHHGHWSHARNKEFAHG
jgi:protoporphyrinogen oxidase